MFVNSSMKALYLLEVMFTCKVYAYIIREYLAHIAAQSVYVLKVSRDGTK